MSSPSSPLRVVGAAILRDGLCLATRRAPHLSNGGLWEFPGGKIEPTETPEEALVREIREELGVSIAVGSHLGTGFAAAGRHQIELLVYAASWLGGTMAPTEHDALCWCDARSLFALRWAAADVPVLDAVASLLRGA